MSLITDSFFYNAIKDVDKILALTDGRIFNPARNEEDDEEDRIPYIIITHDGGNNQTESKDTSSAESEYDSDNVSVLCVADDRESLAELIQIVRKTICIAADSDEAAEERGFAITDYRLSYGPVEMDPSRPCCFQRLTYQCETINL